jgi:hypothetical protein
VHGHLLLSDLRAKLLVLLMETIQLVCELFQVRGADNLIGGWIEKGRVEDVAHPFLEHLSILGIGTDEQNVRAAHHSTMRRKIARIGLVDLLQTNRYPPDDVRTRIRRQHEVVRGVRATGVGCPAPRDRQQLNLGHPFFFRG